MKNLGQILFIILIVAVVFAIIYNWTKKQLSALAHRLIIVEQEIETELENLKLTRAMKEYLDRKIKLLLLGIKVTFCLLLSLIWILLFRDGHDLMNSMFDTFDLMGIIYLSASYIVFNKFTEANTLVTIIGKQVQVWVYRRSKFDPKAITKIEYRIIQKQHEAEQLRKQLNSL